MKSQIVSLHSEPAFGVVGISDSHGDYQKINLKSAEEVLYAANRLQCAVSEIELFTIRCERVRNAQEAVANLLAEAK